MEAIKRNVRYWGRVFEKTAFSILLGSAGYVLMMTLMEGELIWDRIGVKILTFCVFFVLISTFTMAFQAWNVYFPMTISMGSTRKSSFIGMQVMLHVIMAQWCGLGMAGCFFWDNEVKEVLFCLIPGIIGFVVIFLVLANLMCVFAAQFGKSVGVIAYIICFVGTIVGAGFVIVSGVGEGHMNFSMSVQLLLLVIGIAMDVIVMFVYYKVILKYNY